ncbi:hypothetical protein OKA04_08950 [Luteolibacter flavescens]|uniref:Uncharacterized protein n=1 Tax=Luteolibacter flavescens TaxID=1859460 RepID=A0ABT3FNR8_9BACT|nr:hypothetical protein [Luteolibacter flavescens]MCW1884854.1 hypothetical protein [Luteolibacter flavescens]
MNRIPIYASQLMAGLVPARFDKWKLARWKVGDGEVVEGPVIIAELQCDFAVVRHEVFYSGRLHHRIAEGESFMVYQPIASISCSDEEYAAYLQAENARHIRVYIEPDELREVEEFKSEETNEAFVTRIFRAGLKQLRKNRESAEDPL